MSNIELPMPPDNPYSIVQANYFTYVWDARGVPLERTEMIDGREVFVITPLAGERLLIYGRLVTSKYVEDRASDEWLRSQGRVMGEWFSPACPEGELGTVELAILTRISAEEFSAAYQRGWTEEDEDDPSA